MSPGDRKSPYGVRNGSHGILVTNFLKGKYCGSPRVSATASGVFAADFKGKDGVLAEGL